MNATELSVLLEALRPHLLAIAGCAARLLPMAFLCPLLGGQAAGAAVKLGLCLSLAMGVHLAGGVQAPATGTPWEAAALVGKEAVLGVAIGLVIGLPFDAARMGGRFIDTFRGTSAEASLPAAGSREAASGDVLHQLLVALAVTGGAAPVVISGTIRSFGAVGLGALAPGESLAMQIVALAGTALATGLAVGAPILGCTLAVDAAMGVAARAGPNLGIQELAAPARILLGGAVLWIGIGALCDRLLGEVTASAGSLASILEAAR